MLECREDLSLTDQQFTRELGGRSDHANDSALQTTCSGEERSTSIEKTFFHKTDASPSCHYYPNPPHLRGLHFWRSGIQSPRSILSRACPANTNRWIGRPTGMTRKMKVSLTRSTPATRIANLISFVFFHPFHCLPSLINDIYSIPVSPRLPPPHPISFKFRNRILPCLS